MAIGIGVVAAGIAGVAALSYFLKPKPTPPMFIETSNGGVYNPLPENIQLAIDELESGWVRLPPLIFNMQQGIVLRDNISLYGHSWDTKLVFNNDATIGANNASNIALNDLYFTGAGVSHFANCINIEINNVKAEHITKNSSAFTLANCQNSIISNCISDYIWHVYGILLQNSQNCLIDGCDISYITNSYTGIQVLESNYNQISNNHVHHIGMDASTGMTEFDTRDAPGGPGIRNASAGAGSHYNKYLYNEIHHIREHGIKTYPTGSNNEVSYNKISMCNMGNPTGSEERWPYGWCLDMQSSIIIKGNEIWLNLQPRGGIVVGNNSQGAIIEDNKIYHDGEGDRGHCLRVVVDNAIVRNNTFIGNGEFSKFHRAIQIQGSNPVIENNSIEGFTRGMGLTAANYAIVKYNLIKNCERGIKFSGGTGLTVTENTFNCIPTQYEGEETLTNSVLQPNTIIPC